MSLARALAIALLAFAASDAGAVACPETDKVCTKALAFAHPVRKLESWKAAFAKPVEQRFGPAPAALVEYLRLDNIVNDFPERPRPGNPDAKMVAEIRAAIAEMPEKVRRLFDEKFAGLYFIEDLGGTGFTDLIYDGGKEPVAGFILIDTKVLGKRTANQWATWKENTPFKTDPAWKLTARIERDADDSRQNAIQYILLHELGHVASIGRRVHPNWNLEPAELLAAGGLREFAFFLQSWDIEAPGRYVTPFDADFPQRQHVAYYVGAKLNAAQMPATYDNLARTNFPSLYAATVPGDDFAESFASYVHVVLMGKPWEITIARDGKVVKTFGSCWEQSRCGEKRRLLEKLF